MNLISKLRQKMTAGGILLAIVLLALMSHGCSLSAGGKSDVRYTDGQAAGARGSALRSVETETTPAAKATAPKADNKASANRASARSANNGEAMIGSSGNIRTDLYNFTKQVPSKADVGEVISYDYSLTPETKLGSVVVRDMVPAGATLVSTSPEATVEGSNVTWNLGTLQPGERRMLSMKVKANDAGTLKNCATVSAIPMLCTVTTIGKPAIAITKSGPSTVCVGQKVDFVVTVKNDGTSAARDVVVTDPVPAGLASVDGKTTLTYNVGNLNPGETRTFTVPMVAAQRGQHTNTATVNTSNAGTASANAVVSVLKPGLTIAKTGTKEQFVGKTADYVITIENTGDMNLTNVDVVDQVAAPMRLVAAQGATISGNTASWKIASLNKGQGMTFNVKTTSAEAGVFTNSACVTANSACAERLNVCDRASTVWKGFAALLIEVIDSKDPLLSGEETTYVIRVTNQGSAADTNVGIVVNFPEELQPMTANGVTAGKVEGSKVSFADLPSLAARQSVEYRVSAKAVKEGDARVKVLLTSDLLQTPVTEEESTHVY